MSKKTGGASRAWGVRVWLELIGVAITVVGCFGYAAWLHGIVNGLTPDGIRIATQAAIEEIETRTETLGGFPPGTILPYLGNLSDVPTGWVLCGQEGTRSFSERFLFGTTDLDLLGSETGADDHGHSIDIITTGEVVGRIQLPNDEHPEYGDNHGGTNWFHAHSVQGKTSTEGHIPPAVRTFFLCKTN